jgi:ribosomal protein S18 acetylase RimI-like enzyme
MRIAARHATPRDIDILESLYRSLEREMADLHAMWPIADGLDEPVRDSFLAELDDPDTLILIGEIDGYPFGFLLARVEETLTQGGGQQVGAIRAIFVDHEAREVAVGEAMRDMVMDELRKRGITKFDAHVLPGHRLAKNFFESGGFSARSIIMFHDDHR